MHLLSSFPSIRFGLLVGIGGGVPSSLTDIRLGDVVVSKPTGIYGGVVQYDYGKALSAGFQRTSMLNRPPQALLTALSKLQTYHLTDGSRILDFIAEAEQKIPRYAFKFARPPQEDLLYFSDYQHADSDSTSCKACDPTRVVPRSSRDNNEPVVHYGLIASTNKLVRDSKLRDQLSRDLGVYCVDMKSAGLLNHFPCLVVRGICDYADSHRNNNWQGYASVVAAAYAKELLLYTTVRYSNQVQTVRDSPSNASEYYVPFDLSGALAVEDFLGRHDELERLWQHLQPESKEYRKVAVLHGLGGIGKTQLAIRFAREHREHFTAILWLSGNNRETLLRSLSSVLSRILGQSSKSAATTDQELKQNAEQVLRWLSSSGNSRWLVVLDNIDQYSPGTDDGYDIGNFFPTADHGSILITSRLQSITELGRPFPLGGLDFEDANSLLWQSRHLPIPDTSTKLHPDVVDLLNRLGGLPLAITIAGSFMRETGTDISEYLKYYQTSWHDLQSDGRPGRHYQQGNILQTWSASYDAVRKRDSDIAELFLFLAHFDNRDIWYELLKGGQYSPDQPTWLSDVLSDSLTFKKRIAILIEFSFFSLLNVNEQRGSYTMHPVVQDWCLDVSRIEDKERNRRWEKLALIGVRHTIPDIDEPAYWGLQRRLLVHADYVCRSWMSERLMRDVEIPHALRGIGSLYLNQGKWKEAELIYREAVRRLRRVLGEGHTSTLSAINDLGVLYRHQGKLNDASSMHHKALKGFHKTLGQDHRSSLDTLNNLGILYRELGNLHRAEALHQEAMTCYEKILGLNHLSTLDTVNNLGVIYRDQGRFDEADTMHRRALAGFEMALGADHTTTLNVISEIGTLYKNQGNVTEAKVMYQRALAGYEATLGLKDYRTKKVAETLKELG